MLIRDQNPNRELREIRHDADLVVVGGGLAGVCAAVTAAREGARVVLVQDRPVLGGNSSSEVRLWVLGATSHMGNNNRWAREGGLINEILLDSIWRNPEGNAVLFDSLLLEKAVSEPNLTLLLNTAAHDAELNEDGGIRSVRAFCSQNSVTYDLRAPLFCDASGDGVIGFLAGAAFRIGAESRSEFGEGFAPENESQDLLGHSLYFYARDTGRPVRYTPPSFALDDITKIPRFRRFSTQDQGCSLWWIEYGGLRDTVHETEEIKWELWKVVYGVWDHIKNSGEFPDAETMTLEWVGTIPGKRESRRFEGDYMLVQQDVVEQREHHDAVSFGGWAIDLHPSEGVYSREEPCTQWHSRGVYQIPYRCMYSRNVPNLFLAGRIISASHVAFGSSRVMATCAHGGQAVGVAAALCARDGSNPAALAAVERIEELQQSLLKRGQYIPGVALQDDEDLVSTATEITASSELTLAELPPNGPRKRLTDGHALAAPDERRGSAGGDGIRGCEQADKTPCGAPRQQSNERIHSGLYRRKCGSHGRRRAARRAAPSNNWGKRDEWTFRFVIRAAPWSDREGRFSPACSASTRRHQAAGREAAVSASFRAGDLRVCLPDAERRDRDRDVRTRGHGGNDGFGSVQPEGCEGADPVPAGGAGSRSLRILDSGAMVERTERCSGVPAGVKRVRVGESGNGR